MIKGKDLILSVDGKSIAAAKSCTIEISRSFIAVASPVSGKWSNSVPERISWTCSAECLISDARDADDVTQALIDGKEIEIKYYDTEKGFCRGGKGYFATATIQGTVHSLAQFSVTIQGTGELDRVWNKITIDTRDSLQDIYWKANSDKTVATMMSLQDSESMYDFIPVNGERLIKIVANNAEVIYDPNRLAYEMFAMKESIPLSILSGVQVVRPGDTAIFDIPSGRDAIAVLESYEDFRSSLDKTAAFYFNS